MECWWIGDDSKPQWVQALIDRKLLEHHPTYIVDCYTLKQTLETTNPVYLYEGDGLCYCDNKIGVIYGLYKNFKEIERCIPMIKYYCDLCGEEVNKENDFITLKIQSNKPYNTTDYTAEMCKNCYYKIMNLVKTINAESENK